jgi:lysophospholipase L1-like esterase
VVRRRIRRRSWRGRLLALGASLLVTLLLVELGYRLFRPYRGDTLWLGVCPYWRNRPNHSWTDVGATRNRFVWTNAEGHRAASSAIPPDHDAEIAFFGDSNLFGFGVSFPDSLAGRVEALLGRRVANFAVIGYTSEQIRCTMEEALASGRWPRLRVALITSGINDVCHYSLADPPLYFRLIQRFVAVSYISRHLVATLEALAYGDCNEYRPWVPLPAFKENIRAMARLCREQGIVPVFMPDPAPYHSALVRYAPRMPELFPPGSPYWRIKDRDLLGRYDYRYDVARREGLAQWFPSVPWMEAAYWLGYEQFLLAQEHSIDVNALLAPEIDEDPLALFLEGYRDAEGNLYPDCTHPNPAGWRRIAPVVARKIASLLEPPRNVP